MGAETRKRQRREAAYEKELARIRGNNPYSRRDQETQVAQPQEVRIPVVTPNSNESNTETTTPSQRRHTTLSPDHLAPFVALAIITFASAGLAAHGIAIGGFIHLLSIVHQSGLSFEAIQANAAAAQVMDGVFGTSLGITGLALNNVLHTE